MFALLLGLIDPISRIAGKIADARVAQANAQTDRDKIAADERVKGLEAKRDVMVAEQGSRLNPMMRAFLAAPVAILLWKVFVYDKALGQWTSGRTDGLSPELWYVVMLVVGFYFLDTIAARWKR
jgi:hypothetical protein